TFLALWRKDADWAQTRTILNRELLGTSRELDSRIRTAIDRIAAEPTRRIPAGQLARSLGLSESRFLHLFSRETGVPFRRYQLWFAMGAAMRALASGASLTTAALSAGFSSSAHFSSAFREMFGMEPSRLSRAGIEIRRKSSQL